MKAEVLVLALVLLGCGGSKSPTEPAAVMTPTAAPTPTRVPVSAALSGTVTLVEKDASRSPAVGASVTVTGFGVQTLTTNSVGFYSLAAVPVGSVTINTFYSGSYGCVSGVFPTFAPATVINIDCNRL